MFSRCSTIAIAIPLWSSQTDRWKWSSTDNAHKEQLIQIFEGLITQLKEEMIEVAR
jgi:hypothetical protein